MELKVVERPHPTDKSKTIIERLCPFCGTVQTVEVSKSLYDAGKQAYISGKMIQDAFSSFSADVRELLLTGICSTCWNIAL